MFKGKIYYFEKVSLFSWQWNLLILGGDDVQQLCEAGEEEFLGKWCSFFGIVLL